MNASPFYSIIMDTIQDVAKRDHLSQVFRYVLVDLDEISIATDIRIVEAFLGFEIIVNISASELEGQIISCIEGNGLHFSRCRGQGYDGTANMSRIYSGIQARIAEREPLALYMHCVAHCLNLVLNDSVKTVPEIRH